MVRVRLAFAIAVARFVQGVALIQNHVEADAASMTEVLAELRDLKQRVGELQEVEMRLGKVEALLGNGDSTDIEDGTRVPTKVDVGDAAFSLHNRSVFERLRFVERKVDGGLNWVKDPQLFRQVQWACVEMTDLGTDHKVCFDNWPRIVARHRRSGKAGKCIVYDLGIRKNPEFGIEMMKKGCQVRAFDPSPTSQTWWKGEDLSEEEHALRQEIRDAGPDNYKFFPYGAGGVDGYIELYEYNWQQVSIYRAEIDLTKKPKGMPDVPPKSFSLPVKTLRSMMLENGDSYVDVMKVDIEGSEFLFLQEMFDRMGCPPVGQIALEWHHFSIDGRYGSSPEMNALHNLLNSCGFKAFYNRDHWRADPEYDQGARQIPPMRYTLASYCKDCQPEAW